MTRKIQILRLDQAKLRDLLEVAVADAAPEEVMPPLLPYAQGWSADMRQSFLDFFEPMLGTIYGITADGELAGFIRLSPLPSRDGVAETGMWLGRSWRGRGIGPAALGELMKEASQNGFRKVVADTTPENLAAVGTLRKNGATLKIYAEITID
jgi:RimJ/RimL family protein N-acetyltransferase